MNVLTVAAAFRVTKEADNVQAQCAEVTLMATESLRDLIDHTSAIGIEHTLGSVFEFFRHHEHEFVAILDGGKFVGLCSRQELGMLLGSQYGFSLHAHRPVSMCFRQSPIQLIDDWSVYDAFELVFARSTDAFYDDVVVLDREGNFLGLIFTHTLVRLQNHYHREGISLLKNQAHAIAAHNRCMEADLELCGVLQKALLPERFPQVASHAFNFSYSYQSFRMVGGDFFHVQQIDDDAVGILLADVMGHNIRSALIATMMRALMEELAPKYRDAGLFLMHLNKRLAGILSRTGHEVIYATASYLILDAATLSCSFSTAAHPAPILISGSDGEAQVIDHPESGTLLGVFEESEYKTMTFGLLPGDAVLLYTDGILEAENVRSEFFGQSGILSSLARYGRERPEAPILDVLMNDASEFTGPKGFADDICLLLVSIAD
jgi:sigma-B regulation protein RsbU (phosphoserine phosphatase)